MSKGVFDNLNGADRVNKGRIKAHIGQLACWLTIQKLHGRRGDSGDLAGCNAGCCAVKTAAFLDLDKDKPIRAFRDQINLTRAPAPAVLPDTIPPTLVVRGNDLFSRLPGMI